MYICVCVCVSVYIYTYVCMYMLIQLSLLTPNKAFSMPLIDMWVILYFKIFIIAIKILLCDGKSLDNQNIIISKLHIFKDQA